MRRRGLSTLISLLATSPGVSSVCALRNSRRTIDVERNEVVSSSWIHLGTIFHTSVQTRRAFQPLPLSRIRGDTI